MEIKGKVQSENLIDKEELYYEFLLTQHKNRKIILNTLKEIITRGIFAFDSEIDNIGPSS